MNQDPARQASADEIVDREVNNAMITAGMRAYGEFMSLPEAERARRGGADMVARIYGLMEAVRRRAVSEGPANRLSAA